MSKESIAHFSERISHAGKTARDDFGALSADQLNRRPRNGGWSIGQCLDHLITANAPYFDIFAKKAQHPSPANMIERLPFLPSFWGGMLLNMVDPESTRKLRAPAKFRPTPEPVPHNIVDLFCDQQHVLIRAMHQLDHLDLDAVIVTSPALSFVTYSLHDALAIIVAHEERHLRQAQRVLFAMHESDNQP